MKDKKEDVFEEAKKVINPIFNKVLKETDSNHTMVGKKKKSKEIPALYNPHNYRLYFIFKKDNFKPIEGMVGVWFGKLKNYGKEFTALGEGVRVTVKKVKVEVINKLTEQEWFSIKKSKAKEEITDLLEKINKKCIESLRKFIDQYGGSTDFKIINKEGRPNLILNTPSDNKIIKEPYIDSLPRKLTFETNIVKKYYKERSVEYKQAIHAAQHLENSALNDFSPQITNELINLHGEVIMFRKEFMPAVTELAIHMKSHASFMKSAAKFMKKLNNKLSQQDLRKWL